MAERQKIDMFSLAFSYLIFPGFLFTALAGMLVYWLDRKITARLQWRKGPSFFQPFYDVIKLFVKETIIPAGGNTLLFVSAPFISLFSIILVSNVIISAWLNPYSGFIGDLIVVFYLLALPAVASILGASASHNPFASLGASREMKLVLAYELPLILSILVPVIKASKISLHNIIYHQLIYGSFTNNISGILALIVAVLCIQAKIGAVPFDLAEAETEIAGGSQIEYSGPLLGIWKLNKMMTLFIAPLFVTILFWSGGSDISILYKFFIILLASILIRNTNPRLRIDQALKFFWGPVTLIGIAAIIFAFIGK